MKLTKIICLATVIFILVSCENTDNTTDINENIADTDSVQNNTGNELSIYTIPTPVLISNILKLYDIKYDPEILESNKSVEREQFSSLSLSLNLGLNLVDLSYSTIFEQTQYSIKYLNYIDNVLAKMNVRNHETIFVLDRFRKNMSEPDSLSAMLIDFQNKLNEYYVTEQDNDIPLFIISGIYIEGLYISLHYHNQLTENNKFYNKHMQAEGYKNLILQQKAYLDNIDELLSKYKKEENSKLFDYYKQLKKQFEQLNITYSTNEKTNKIININYNRAEIKNLKNLTGEIREFIMNM